MVIKRCACNSRRGPCSSRLRTKREGRWWWQIVNVFKHLDVLDVGIVREIMKII